jgi:PEP-CTERM/exosortase A-associated glycosyltransferase
MKVLHVLHYSVPSLSGYTVRSRSIVCFQAKLGLEPVVVTSPRQEPVPADQVEVFDDVRYYRTPPPKGRGTPFLRELQAVGRTAARIEEVVQIEKPDVLHAHSPCLWGAAAARVAKRRRLPLVYEVRGNWEDAAVDLGKMGPKSLRYRLSRAWETRVARAADAVTTIADGLRIDLVQRGIDPRKIVLVPNGVNVDAFTAQPPDEDLMAQLGLRGRVCIGYVGSIFPWEGIIDLVRAIPRIAAAAPEVKCLIVGGGEQQAEIRRMIDELDVADHVLLTGKVPHEDIRRYYSVLDVMIYPRRSTRNTELVTPLKPLEAMAMGKAVLGSDVGGISELLADGTGLRFRAGDPADLADKCLQLITQPQTRESLGRNARAHVTAQRDWKKLVARYTQVYAAAVNGHR